jgi:hypothetical protein
MTITVPAYLFIGAFSLACPAVLPVRVYQVLYSGYWIWGNYISPGFIPTLNGTLLTASGNIVADGFFGIGYGGLQSSYTALQAVGNLALLLVLSGVALFALQVPQLKSTTRKPWSARLAYAYADALLASGDESGARDWFARAADFDDDAETDAADRLAELDGIVMTDLLEGEPDSDEDEFRD